MRDVKQYDKHFAAGACKHFSAGRVLSGGMAPSDDCISDVTAMWHRVSA